MRLGIIILGVVALAAVAVQLEPPLVGQKPLGIALPVSVPRASGCDIKGNISVETGERIYHLPGQKYYSSTRIDGSRGERWFCSESDARAAGWRKSRV
jgi:hypothetical protein